MLSVIEGLVACVQLPLNGVVLMMLWGWFMVPTLGLPIISLVQAIGINLVISFLTQHHVSTDLNDIQRKKRIGYALSTPLVYLFLGWIVHLW